MKVAVCREAIMPPLMLDPLDRPLVGRGLLVERTLASRTPAVPTLVAEE